MNNILNCSICNNHFDTNKHSPYILPCDNQACLSCIESFKQILSGYAIKCKCQYKIHNINKIEDIPISQFALTTGSDSMNQLVDNFKYGLELTKFNLSQHYDDMEMKIDIKAETLIDFIHNSRELLHKELETHRLETVKYLEIFQFEYNKQIHHLELELQSGIIDLSKFILNLNKLQRSIDLMKKKSWYFIENNNFLDKSLLGHCLNNETDQNYSKIKNIKMLLNNPMTSFNFSLKPQFNDSKLRHYVTCLTRNRTVCCYFDKSRSIYLELFNNSGNSLKIIQAAEEATYFPQVTAYNDHLLFYYTSKSNQSCQSNVIDDSSTGYISLYDSELNLLKKITEKSIIESIFINESRIILTFSHRSSEVCKVFDYDLDYLESFGQQNDPEVAFYMNKVKISAKEFAKEKMNPIVFGFDKDNIYFYSKKSMSIMSRKSGLILKSILKTNEKSFFILDSQSNIIEINVFSSNIILHNLKLDIKIDSFYDNNFDSVSLIENQYFAFVSLNKTEVTII
jgi:hypothetical protein